MKRNVRKKSKKKRKTKKVLKIRARFGARQQLEILPLGNVCVCVAASEEKRQSAMMLIQSAKSRVFAAVSSSPSSAVKYFSRQTSLPLLTDFSHGSRKRSYD